MSLKYLLDENMSPLYREQLLRVQGNLTVRMVGDPGLPPKVGENVWVFDCLGHGNGQEDTAMPCPYGVIYITKL